MSDGKFAEYLVDKLFALGNEPIWTGSSFRQDRTQRIAFMVEDPLGYERESGGMSRGPLVKFFERVIEEYNHVER